MTILVLTAFFQQGLTEGVNSSAGGVNPDTDDSRIAVASGNASWVAGSSVRRITVFPDYRLPFLKCLSRQFDGFVGIPVIIDHFVCLSLLSHRRARSSCS